MNIVHNIHKTTHIGQLTAVFLFLLLALPMAAQEKEDSVFLFRFFSQRNGFYAPGLNNGEELKRLYAHVDEFKDLISNHEVTLYVNGYYIADGPQAETRATAKTRSNRVKSELIVLKGLKEDNFITKNQPGDANYVTVQFSIPLSYFKAPKEEPAKEEPVKEEPIKEEPVKEEPTAEENVVEVTVEEPVTTEQPEPFITDSVTTVEDITVTVPAATPATGNKKVDSHLALKTNLLYYAVLMPNLELEWSFKKQWSVALEGQGAWYAKTEPHKVYRLATLMPELRYWPIEHKRWHGMYVGAFAVVGEFDLCNGDMGHEGEGYGAGLSAGYMWPIGKYLSLDAGIGVGYLRIHDKEYKPFEGHFLYQRTRNINYFGPLRLKLSLVWRFQCEKTVKVK